MNIPQEFDTIRPWEPEDLPEVFDRLLSNDQFKQVLAYLYPQVYPVYPPFGANPRQSGQCSIS